MQEMGKRQGPFKQYEPDTKDYCEGEFKDWVVDGIMTCHESFRKIKSEYVFQKGDLVETRIFSPEGQLSRVEPAA